MILSMDKIGDVPPWQSLPLALMAVARRFGTVIDFDDLNAALGLSTLTCAVSTELDCRNWCLYARDAFLPEAAKLFGMDVREIHPPESAVGLAGFKEFDQHFDASYRPLVSNALSHGQAVIAWRGWPKGRELCWGIIQKECHEGIGFEGAVYQAPDSPNPERIEEFLGALEEPPVQIYVIERVLPVQPTVEQTRDTAIEHALHILRNDCGSSFGAITGPLAFDEWIGFVRAGTANEAESTAPLDSSRSLAGALLHAHRSAVRFWTRQDSTRVPSRVSPWEAVTESLRDIVSALERVVSAPVPQLGRMRSHLDTIVTGLADARAASLRIKAALSSRTEEAVGKRNVP